MAGPDRRLPRRLSGFALAALLGVGCRPSAPADRSTDPASERAAHDPALTSAQAAYLERLARQADEDPGDFSALKASGMAHMRFTLSGVLSLQTRAERDLEAAFALDPADPQLNRSLGRFYNMRAVAGDDSKAQMQVAVYGALLGDADPTTMDSGAFVSWSFYALGRVLTYKNRGRLLKALSTVRELEETLAARTKAHPDDIELFALAGNFAFFFAGNLPTGKRARVEAAVAYFETLRQRWQDLRPGARDPDDCPNTYENFMFELAEGLTVLGRLEEARAIYRELSELEAPITRAKEQIAFVSAERGRNAERYVGEMKLMPPWPSDVGNCVVCHAWTRDVPLTTLHTVETITLDAIPTHATPKPVAMAGPLDPKVRVLVDRRCVSCHRRAGEAGARADFTSDEGVLARGRAVVRRVTAGEMPPTGPLSAQEQAVLREWLGEE